MNRLLLTVFVIFFIVALAFAQAPPKDAKGCTDPAVLTRMTGCTIRSCRTSAYDVAKMPTAKTGERLTAVEGQLQSVAYSCTTDISGLQIARNAENALQASGYKILFTDSYGTTRYWVTARNGAQWVTVHSEGGVQRGYDVVAVKTKEMEQEMQATTADGWAKQIAESGRASIYGVNFDTGKATIRADSEKVLNEVATLLRNQPEWYMVVAGHTDNVGADAVNVPLSRQRAEAVIAWLASQGIEKARLTPAGFGSRKPVADNATEDGRAKNRRVDLVKLY